MRYIRRTINDTKNYNIVTKSITVTVGKANPTINSTATSVTYASGLTLGNVSLPSTEGNTSGSWAWENPNEDVGDAGEHGFNAIYTPNDTKNYNIVTKSITVTVGKADPTINSTATNVTYEPGLTLENVPFPSTEGNTSGSWAWENPNENVGDAGEHGFNAIYTPNDTKNYNIVTKSITVTVGKATPQASDFVFRRPSSLTYDGKGKVATVTSDKEGIGTITIKYCKKGSDSWTGTAPINVGTYKVKIDVADGDNYNAGTNITADDWTFTIGYLNDEDLKCTISGPAYEDDNTYWLRDDDTATINPPEGYKISTSEDSSDNNWKDYLEVSECWNKEDKKIYLRNKENNEITDAIKILKDINWDVTAPNGSIKLNNRTPWESFINLITFGLFFKDKQQTVTITATDNESGIKEAKYLVSNSDLIQKENATSEEIATILDGQTGWAIFVGSSTDIVLEEDNKYVVYEKITDNVGHVTYISSDGIVVYSDSTTDTDTVSYPKTTKKDIEVKITTNSNTIKGIKIDSGELDEKNYEVSAEDENKKSTITFKGLYLDTLSAGSHQLIISYNPQGESYVNGTSEGDEPEETQIELFVQTLNIDTDGDGKADINIDTDGDGKADINIDTDGDGKADINIDTDGDGKADINIDTDGDGEADINIDTNEDGEADINIDTDGDDEADINIDTNEDGEADINIDTNEDGEADINIDTDGDGEADFNVDIDGDGKPDINVDKSTWGEKVENSGVINYVDEKGTTSAEITKFGMIWLKEKSNGTSAWYGIDNSKGIFKLGSRFSVRWLSKDSDPEEWENYYNNLDENHKKAVESDRVWIFLAEVIDNDGVKYTNFDSELPFYIELGQDWDKDDINAVFISQGADEVLDTEYVDDMECPEGSKEFAKLTLKHFSPYAIYDYLENQEALPDEIENNVKFEDEMDFEDEVNDLSVLFNWFVTGDTNTLIILTGLAVLVISSGILIVVLKKKRKK